MLVIKLILAFGIFFGGLIAGYAFDEHCGTKFGHRFFAQAPFIWFSVAFLSIVGGVWWYRWAEEAHYSTLNGIVLIVLGVAGLLGQIIFNVLQTSLGYGLGGTLLQFVAFGMTVAIAFPLYLLITGFVVVGKAIRGVEGPVVVMRDDDG